MGSGKKLPREAGAAAGGRGQVGEVGASPEAGLCSTALLVSSSQVPGLCSTLHHPFFSGQGDFSEFGLDRYSFFFFFPRPTHMDVWQLDRYS